MTKILFNPRILFGLTIIIAATAAIMTGATGAFFSDTERSLGNMFTAGEVDLKVDNDSYYNENHCVDTDQSEEGENWQWQGNAPYPVPGSPCETSWPDADLNNGVETLHKFFNFTDLKPDDEGEDTISLHVQNDAWMCMDLTLTSNDDFSSTEPELLVDGETPNVAEDLWDGELAQNIQMVWWADDGDNVLEEVENHISGGVKDLFTLASTTGAWSVRLADSSGNIWNGNVGEPVEANVPHYIAKAWCFGTLELDPLPNPEIDRDPLGQEGPGWSCDGTLLGNGTQTDQATLDISFSAVQARHNEDFLCDPGEPCVFDPELNLIVDGGFEFPEVTNGAQWDIFPSPAGAWTVEWRTGLPVSFDPSGSVPLQARPVVANLELHEGVLGAASEGNQYAELDTDWTGHGAPQYSGEPASVTIYQDVPTIPGATYKLDFDWAARPSTVAANNRLEVHLDGALALDTGTLADPNAGITWVPGTVSPIIATDSSLRVQFTDVGTADTLGTFLDNVRLVQTSCPAPI